MRAVEFNGHEDMPGTAEQLSDLIGAIYDCALNPGQWLDVLDRICVYSDSAAGTLAVLNLLTGEEYTMVNRGITPEFDQLYKQKYHCTDLFIHPLLTRNVCEPAISSDLVSDDELLASRIYREWAAPQGFRDTLMTMFTRHHARLSFLGLTRKLEQRRYDERDRQAIKLIAPHIQRAVTISDFIEHRSVERSRFVELIDSIMTATLVVDANLRVLHANAVGRGLLEQGEIASAPAGTLVVTGVPLARILDAHKRNPGVRPLPETHRIRRKNAQADTIIVIMPLLLTRGVAEPRGLQYAVFMHDSSQLSPLASEVWSKLFELTGGELRVLEGLIRGMAASDIADLYGIARSTVKTHMLNLFRKTGTNRQAELVKLALSSIPPVQAGKAWS